MIYKDERSKKNYSYLFPNIFCGLIFIFDASSNKFYKILPVSSSWCCKDKNRRLSKIYYQKHT